ncbi:MAG: hypothetical protein LBI35_00130, partial [Burkholderiales bacterium]|nr:hypothetical protein [Burkholderiales bacterium]
MCKTKNVMMPVLAFLYGILAGGYAIAQPTTTKEVLERRAATQQEAQQRVDQKNETYTQFLTAVKENRANDVTAMIK